MLPIRRNPAVELDKRFDVRIDSSYPDRDVAASREAEQSDTAWLRGCASAQVVDRVAGRGHPVAELPLLARGVKNRANPIAAGDERRSVALVMRRIAREAAGAVQQYDQWTRF